MADLVAWLRARLDEDERAADAIENASYMHGVESDAEAEILRFADPDRIRREVESKRRIIEPLEGIHAEVMGLEDRIMGEWGCGGPDDRDVSDGLLKLLALPYSDRPGYREEWRP